MNQAFQRWLNSYKVHKRVMALGETTTRALRKNQPKMAEQPRYLQDGSLANKQMLRVQDGLDALLAEGKVNVPAALIGRRIGLRKD